MLVFGPADSYLTPIDSVINSVFIFDIMLIVLNVIICIDKVLTNEARGNFFINACLVSTPKPVYVSPGLGVNSRFIHLKEDRFGV